MINNNEKGYEKNCVACMCVFTYEGKERERDGKERTTVGKHVQKLDQCVLCINFKMLCKFCTAT